MSRRNVVPLRVSESGDIGWPSLKRHVSYWSVWKLDVFADKVQNALHAAHA